MVLTVRPGIYTVLEHAQLCLNAGECIPWTEEIVRPDQDVPLLSQVREYLSELSG